MRKYYIVTQADTDEDGHFQYANGVFQDDDGTATDNSISTNNYHFRHFLYKFS